MAKTYNSIPTVSTGDVYTATAHNNIVTNVNNYRVPPSVSVYRSSTLTSYTANTAITWQAAHYDTESPSDPMWSSGSATLISIKTTGLYLLTFAGRFQSTATTTIVVPQITRSSVNILSGFSAVANGNESRFSLSGIVQLTAADSLTASIYAAGGSAYSLEGSATYGEGQTRLALTWLGQVS